MRRALLFVVSSFALAGLAEGTLTGCGGGGGAAVGGSGGGGPEETCMTVGCPSGYRCDRETLKCEPDEGDCDPECVAGSHCVRKECFPDYTISFIDPPTNASVNVRLVVEVRPAPDADDPKPVPASEIKITALFNAIPIPEKDIPELVPVEGQDNRWQLNFDLSGIKTNLGDGLPLRVEASLPAKPGVPPAIRTVNIDNKPPELNFESPGSLKFRRDALVHFRGTVSDAHDQGTRLMAYLTGKNQVPPPVDQWFEGTPDPTDRQYWVFDIDQRSPLTNLEGLEGTLDVHLYASDLYGNFARKVYPNAINVTREAWFGDMATPITAGPAMLPDGRLAFLVYGGGASGSSRIGLFDEDGNKTTVNVGNLSTAHALSVGRDGGLYLVEGLAVVHASIDGTKLADPPTLRCRTPSGTSSKAVLAEVGEDEVAFVTLTDGTMALISSACTDSTPPVRTQDIDIQNATPVVTLDPGGNPVIFVGGQTLAGQQQKRTMNLFALEGGAFVPLNGIAPQLYGTLRESELALDGYTLLAWPRYTSMGASLAFDGGFDQSPLERVYTFAGITIDNARMPPSPIVTESLVVFPTPKGIQALPRTGPWSRAVSYATGVDFRATPVVGDGDVIYAITYGGVVHAMAYSEVNGPELVELWTTQLGMPGSETFSAPLTLTCGGVLVAGSEQGKIYTVITDSRGMDPDAPWPKYQHDLRNTGNNTVNTSCD